MALNINDSNKISYKAKIDWYKQRFADITSGDEALAIVTDKVGIDTAEQLMVVLSDLIKKSKKLDGKIDFLSKDLRIPIDRSKQPTISNAVMRYDPNSQGEYITYSLYSELLNEKIRQDREPKHISELDGFTGDAEADSLLVSNEIMGSNVDGNVYRSHESDSIENIANNEDVKHLVNQVVEYVGSFLNRYPDTKYIPWRAKEWNISEQWEATDLQSFWGEYSNEISDKARGVGTIGGKLFGDKEKTSLVKDESLFDITKKYVGNLNKFMNSLDETLGFGYTADLLCCFFKWTGRIDTKTLKAINMILNIFKNGISLDADALITSIKNMINSVFRGILTAILGLVMQLIQRVVEPVKKWINNDDPNWEIIKACTPIDEMINRYLFSAINKVEEFLEGLMKDFYKKYELKELDLAVKETILAENKEIGEITKMLEHVINALDTSAVCGTAGSPNDDPVKQIMEAYNIGPDTVGDELKYIYPEDDNPTIYNSFIRGSDDIELTSSDTNTDNNSTVKARTPKLRTQEITSKNLNDCLKKIMPEGMTGVDKWFEELKSESQGSQQR